jgi:hypothetical protein
MIWWWPSHRHTYVMIDRSIECLSCSKLRDSVIFF